MKLFSVFGITGSGKTTTIERIISELVKRGYTVGSVKDIHFEAFAMDTEGSNTDRHRKAGSQQVTARGLYETDILYQRQLKIDEILQHYDHDFVVLEGVESGNFPKIVTGHNLSEVKERYDPSVMAISGRVSSQLTHYNNVPAIDATTDIERLVDLIEDQVYERLPDFPAECCTACGQSCQKLGQLILRGEARREDCVLQNAKIRLSINGNPIEMVPFVQTILTNAIEGVVKELDGYQKGAPIEIEIT